MKKLIMLSLFTYTLSFTNAAAQGVWSPRTSLPDSTRGYGIGFSIGKFGYMGLGGRLVGSFWQYFNDFWQFDPSTDTWTRKADFPGKARIEAVTFVIGNYAYLVTGGQMIQGYDLVTECWQYNSITDTWIQKHDFPGISRYGAIAFAIGKNGYLGTGYDTLPSFTPVLRDFWEYDTTSDTWTQKHNFGGIARYLASGFAVGGKGYICFGADSANNTFSTANDIWEYDTASDSWTQKSNNPTDSLAGASGFVIGNNIYVGTGEHYFPVKAFNHFWQYNTTTDIWIQQASFLGGEKVVCSAFAVGDTGYLGLGNYDSLFTGTNTFFRFEPDSTTSISELQSTENGILIYPNPFKAECFINLPEGITETPIFTLFDMEGLKEEINIQGHDSNYTLSGKGLANGLYILSIKYNNQVFYKKLVITN
jgi:N-acetylneuraminic acid mutarotase